MHQTAPIQSGGERPVTNQQQTQDILDLINSPYWVMLSPGQQRNWQNQLNEVSGDTNATDDSPPSHTMKSVGVRQI